MLYRHIFDKISSEFCGILHVAVNFADLPEYCGSTTMQNIRSRGNSITTIACENSSLFSLLTPGDVSRGGMSATQRKKFHTDDVESVWNPVMRADWTTE